MKSLIEKYDDIFLNQSRLCFLIDKFNQENEFEKLDVLSKLIAGYIYYRGSNLPNVYPMSMLIILDETIETEILENIIDELSVENEDSPLIDYNDHRTYITFLS